MRASAMKHLMLLTSLLVLVYASMSVAHAEQASPVQVPVMLYVSRSDCRFCRQLEKDILGPLIRSGIFTDKLVIRYLVLDSSAPLLNFEGESVSPTSLAENYGVKLTPTLLFLDARGKELVPRIVGYQKSDYYAYYVEEAIHTAAALLERR